MELKRAGSQPSQQGSAEWEFERNGREFRVRVEGQLIFNSITPILEAALAGSGVAYLTKHQVQRHLDDGQLTQVLSDWSPPFSGYHLYYPSRRQPSPAFALVVETLRLRAHARKRR